MRLFALPGVLQNDAAPMNVDHAPFLDLFQGSEAAEAGEVVVQAAISNAGGLSGAVDFTHGYGVEVAACVALVPGETLCGWNTLNLGSTWPAADYPGRCSQLQAHPQDGSPSWISNANKNDSC
jgi:hypothetical protein